jgi:fluoride exporter
VTIGSRGVALFLGAALLGGVGGSLRFAFAHVSWATFLGSLFGVWLLAAVGTGLRIALQDFAVARHRPLRIGMLAANLIGTAALAFALERPQSILAGVAFTVGFCGGLTTFSGFIAEALALLHHRHRVRAALFVLATLGLSFELFHLLHATSPAPFPWRTMIVNLTGCFAFGIIDKAVDPSPRRSELHRLLLAGLLGGYTTLSTLVAETMSYGATDPGMAAINVGVQLFAGAGLVIAGRKIGVQLSIRLGPALGLAPNQQSSTFERRTSDKSGAQ